MFESIFYNVIASFIWFVLGIAAYHISRIYFVKNPTKRLWKLKNTKDLVICSATSSQTDTGEYFRPATGIGQLRALGSVVESLSKAYDVKIKSITLSVYQMQKKIEKDVILLGGPKNNKITRLFLDKIRHLNVVDQNNSVINWLNEHPSIEYEGKSKDKKIVKDYGLIISMENPFASDKNSTINLFSGCHTYGTIAAARYFTEYHIDKFRGFTKNKKNFCLLVSCDVVDGYPVGIKLIKEYEF